MFMKDTDKIEEIKISFYLTI